MAESSEIATATKVLSTQTLGDVLKQFGKDSIGEKDTLLARYQSTVLNAGLENFLLKLSGENLKDTCKSFELKSNGTEKQLHKTLKQALSDKGINDLLSKVDLDLLKRYSTLLALDRTDNGEELKKQVSDELMLTGMESFLNKLTLALLKAHCSEMNLEFKSNAQKKELVDKLMVHIFELEPLPEDASKVKDKSPKTKEKKEKQPKKEVVKEPKPKREAWVAPPLDTIAKGQHDNFTAIFDNFNIPDLHKFCKDKGLKISGKKKDIIKRIIAYLETGNTEEPAKKRKRPIPKEKSKSPTKKQKVSKEETQANKK